ncbi:PA3371 family protein [Aquipseudomonas alcaligenes]|uniref:PA3371 family protein n=1 Tax=Aquipseudomonas alcaligenes TaxID=43263 RepID=UPI003747E8D2
MSRSAILTLIMTLLCLCALWLYPGLEETPALALKCTAGFFASAFVVALAAGRRYKFDPILR